MSPQVTHHIGEASGSTASPQMRTARLQGHWQEIQLIIYITLHLCASKFKLLCLRTYIYKDKNTVPGMMGMSCVDDGLAVSFR